MLIMMGALCLVVSGFAQVDSSGNRVDTVRNGETTTDSTTMSADTIRVGNMIIIKDRKRDGDRAESITRQRSNDNVSTSWLAFDIGFSRVDDNTNYPSAIAAGLLPAGAGEDWFDQRGGKSINIGIWIFNQRVNLAKHVLNFKYAVGLELNNYRYRENILFQKTSPPLVLLSAKDFKKNKLAADYLTVPLMLNLNFRPGHRQQFDISAGISVGYLYSSRQKTVGGGDGKTKYRDNFELRPWKLAYVGEVGLGDIKLYGSYAFKSMFKNTLDQTPFTIGLRISNPN
jgi:Outer membrane protein beta-barrel domain